MNKAFALAVLMSAAAFGGAQAREMTAKPASDVTVVYTDPEIGNSAKRLDLSEAIMNPTQAMIDQARSEIRHDPSLRAALVQQSVELNNVVAIDTAANGGHVVYVR